MPKQTRAQKLTEKNKEILFHLLDCGWRVNQEYLETMCKDKNLDPNQLDVILLGKLFNDYHLESVDGKYACRIKSQGEISFWQKEPRWVSIGKVRTLQVELVEGGIRHVRNFLLKQEVVTIVLPEEYRALS